MSSAEFEAKLNKLDESDWNAVLETALPEVHEVDRNATKIWFSFYPLALHKHLADAGDREKEMQSFVIKGAYGLDDKIDSSHSFLYGHRFWPEVKQAIIERAESFDAKDLSLEQEAASLAESVAGKMGRDVSLVTGIVLVGLMTLTQTGLDAFSEGSGAVVEPTGLLKNSPEKILELRSRGRKEGFFGFLKTVDKEYTVVWDESEKKARFEVIYDEEIASGAARDQSRDWKSNDARCIEGVIPVECRSAACGTCWIGVIDGAERLSEVDRLERKQMKVFGYRQEDVAKPVMRLACQARAEGSVTIVMPPWNGVFGKKIYGVEEVRLEPATKSARKLRETIADAMGSDK